MMSISSSKRPLFGGAIVADFPSRFIDASDLRQVPDTQEVLLDPQSEITAILEVLEKVTKDGAGDSLEEAIKYHFDSLAHDNESHSFKITEISPPPSSTDANSTSNPNPDSSIPNPATPSAITLQGLQSIQKFNRDGSDQVRIWLALWRLETKNVDLVLSVNEPLVVYQPGNDHGHGHGQAGGEGGSEPNDANRIGDQSQDLSQAKEIFLKAVHSLQILDWGLFA